MRILCAVDGSEHSQWGIQALEAFAGHEPDQVVLLHIIDQPSLQAAVNKNPVARKRALAAMEAEDKRAYWEARFLEAQENGFVPAGRINSAAGTDLCATLINCFVQPVGDSIVEVVDGKPGIYTALAQAAPMAVNEPGRPCCSTLWS